MKRASIPRCSWLWPNARVASDSQARGPAGSIGLLQIKPTDCALSVARENGWEWEGETTLLDPSANLRIGAAYLTEMQRRFESWEGALAAYNMGPARLHRRVSQGSEASSRFARAILSRRDELALELITH